MGASQCAACSMPMTIPLRPDAQPHLAFASLDFEYCNTRLPSNIWMCSVCYQLYFIQCDDSGEEILKSLRSVLEGKLHLYKWPLTEQGPMSNKNHRRLFFKKKSWEQKYKGNTEILKQVTVDSTPADIRHQEYQEETPGKAVQAAGLQTALPGVIGCPHPCYFSPQASDSFGSKRRKQPQAQAGIQGALSFCSQRQRLMQLLCDAERQLFCCLHF